MSMNLESASRSEEKMWGKVNKLRRWLTTEDKNEWLKDMRGMLSVVATVIATLTFQVALNPPGGIKPASDDIGDIICDNKMNFRNPCPGQAILPAFYKDNYKTFLSFNTTCFASSLIVCLWLVSGLPLNNRLCTWFFSIIMCITLTTLALTYWSGVRMVTPFPVFSEKPTITVSKWAIGFWIIMLVLVALFYTIRLIIWIATKHIKTWMRSNSVK